MGLTDDRNDPGLGKNRPDGQQEAYLILPEEELAKGFVRPVRTKYQHVGPEGPTHPLRELTLEEAERYAGLGYLKFEEYPESEAPRKGKFWSEETLNRKGCGGVTTMALPLAETYARQPDFYGGTFCATCKQHFPVAEFVWEGTSERVGS